MKRILMIGTGGTIASRQTENGLAPGLTPQDILSYIPQVEQVCEVETFQVCNIDSTNVTPEHWKLIVEAVEERYDSYDGFVICHGTDTLAYTAAALSYIGLGVQPPTPEWGAMLADARSHILNYPYLIMFPGLIIALTVLAINLIGDGLRDALDPKLRK